VKCLSLRLGFPLLVKELVEQAARRRTYVLRAGYAAILFFAFALFFYDKVPSETKDPFQVLGIGKQMFEFLVVMQFVGVYLFLPALMSGALTYEKERRSLELLFLTDLRPWEILLQKLMGRLVPIFTFLLLSLPLMAVTYSFGGLTTDYLLSGVLLLVLACLQVGAFCLMVSAFCRTTAQSFVASYILLGAFYFAILLFWLLLDAVHVLRFRHASEDVLFGLLPVYLFDQVARKGFGEVAVHSIPIVISISLFLAMARAFLFKRAFLPPRNLTLGLFMLLDRIMSRANRIIGNVMLVKDRPGLPTDEPIAWREVKKRSLGKVHYLFRILVATEAPVLFVAATLLAVGARRSGSETFSAMVFVMWGIAALAVTVTSANAIASERASQTLEVLLATPLEGREIVRQKRRGVARLMHVFLVPFLTLFVLEAWWEAAVWTGSYWPASRAELGAFGYLLTSALTVFVYLPMFSWVALWIGLRLRTKARAIMTALGALVVWNGVPVLLILMVSVLIDRSPDRTGLSYLLLLSPATIIPLLEYANSDDVFREVFSSPAAVPIFLNFLWHVGALYYFRHLCLKHADRYLGRVPAPPEGPGRRGRARRLAAALRGAFR
jgi:ABC-type transport system involved in multi-copper enzyme maturation permease subunit